MEKGCTLNHCSFILSKAVQECKCQIGRCGLEVNEHLSELSPILAHVLHLGLAYDREWAIVDASGRAIRMKMAPNMSQIHPVVDLRTGCLVVRNLKGIFHVLSTC